MKEIVLSQGRLSLVDDSLYDDLNQVKWSFDSGCAVRRKDKKKIYLHRVIMSTPDGYVTDHINGNKLDNRKINLRICTTKQNARNRKLNKDNTSGYKGVSISYKCGSEHEHKWKSIIRVNYRFIYLGTFISKIEAALAYNNAAKRFYGKFANLNVI